jgi:phytoene dehydrogenase-like protein
MWDLQESDVVIVGAGLAGQRCASVREHAGLSVTVLEARDAVGGRVRTDVIDGFRCDRGFQVLNPSYPQVKSAIDIDALDLKRFDAGLRVRTSGSDSLSWPHHDGLGWLHLVGVSGGVTV